MGVWCVYVFIVENHQSFKKGEEEFSLCIRMSELYLWFLTISFADTQKRKGTIQNPSIHPSQ